MHDRTQLTVDGEDATRWSATAFNAFAPPGAPPVYPAAAALQHARA